MSNVQYKGLLRSGSPIPESSDLVFITCYKCSQNFFEKNVANWMRLFISRDVKADRTNGWRRIFYFSLNSEKLLHVCIIQVYIYWKKIQWSLDLQNCSITAVFLQRWRITSPIWWGELLPLLRPINRKSSFYCCFGTGILSEKTYVHLWNFVKKLAAFKKAFIRFAHCEILFKNRKQGG